MAPGITGKSHARQVQRKLTTIVRSLQQYPEIQIIFDALDEISSNSRSKRKSSEPEQNIMNFLFDERLKDEYVENIPQFVNDIQKCINAFVKKTNDKTTAQTFTAGANALLMEHFNISLDSAIVSAVSAPVQTTREEKTAMRSIITSLSQHEHAAPFLYPVNQKEYPEYYEIIKSPMDLNTLKKKIPNCSVDEFISNLALIWSNCMTVNKKRSEIYQWGLDMKEYCDRLIYEIFPSSSGISSEDVESSRKRRKYGKTDVVPASQGVAEVTLHETDMKAIKAIFKAVQSHELSSPFHYPVDGVAFPDYYEKISHPIDFSTIKLKLKSYDRTSFYDDLNRVYTNCMEYNLPGSDIYNQAEEMQKFTNEQFISHFGSLPTTSDPKKNTTRKKPANIEEVAAGASNSCVEDDQKAFKRILKTLHMHESSIPFHYPVDGTVFPDYYEKISHPIDFSTIKLKLKSYDRTSFYDDLNRVYTNCMEYNLPGSDIYNQAEEMQKFTNEQFISHFGSLPGHISLAPVSSRDSDVKLMKKVLQALYANPLSVPFHYPVSAEAFPDYYEKIANPIDYSTIKKNIKSYDRNSFYHALNRIYTNCMDYNVPGSDICKQAEAMRKFTETEYVKVFGGRPDESPKATSTVSENRDDDYKTFKKIMKQLIAHPDSKAFHYPVDSALFPDYYDKIVKPMDYSAINTNLKLYDRQSFYDDLMLVCSNCMQYNQPGSDIYKQAKIMQAESSILYEKHFGVAPASKRKTNRRRKSEGDDTRKAQTDKTENKSTSRRVKIESIASMLSRLSYDELECLIGQLDRNDNEPVRKRCKLEAVQYTSKFDVPHTVENHTIINFGEFTLGTSDNLCPNNFSSSTALRIYYDVEDDSNIRESNYSDVVLDLDATQVDSDVYITVSSQNHHIVSATSCNAVAQFLHEHPKQLINILSNAMRRSYGVFNVICSMDTIEPFLEPITCDKYYSHIKTPICLRDIYEKFSSYGSVFEFCFDMKLVFYNCMRYNKNTSALYRNASNLLSIFDHLFCSWVLNIKCAKQKQGTLTVSVAPNGPWEDWQYLKYFDSEMKHVNKCAITGIELPEEELLFCDACENQYVQDAVQGTKEGRKWYCPRCSLARAVHYSSFELDSAVVKSNFTPMRCSQNIHEYVNSTDMEFLGFYRDEKDNLFMDPFGSVVLQLSVSDAGASKVAYQHMLQERENEFKENRRRHKRKSTNLMAPSSLWSSSRETFLWYNAVLRNVVDGSKAILPLHHVEVQRLFEGLPGFDRFGQYSQFDHIRTTMIHEARLAFETMKAERASYESLNLSIEKEKSFWTASEVNFDEILTNPPPFRQQEHPQLSQYLNPVDLDESIPFATIVQLYDVVAAASNLMGYVCIGMWDLANCLSPKSILQPSVIEFDELCCSLVNFLLHDIRRSLVIHDDLPLHKALAAYTMNILTWNHNFIDVLSILILVKLGKYELAHVLAHLSMSQSLHQRVMLIVIVAVLSYVELTHLQTNKLLQLWMSRSPINDFLAVLMEFLSGDESAIAFVKCILLNYETILTDLDTSIRSYKTADGNAEAEGTPPSSENDKSNSAPSHDDPSYILASRVERSLRCALLRDSDSYTTEERIDILMILTEFVSATALYREHRYKALPQQEPNAFIERLSSELCIASNDGKTCFFTGIKGLGTHEDWVVVPDYLLADPTLEQPNVSQLYKFATPIDAAEITHSTPASTEPQRLMPVVTDTTPLAPRRVVLAIATAREEARVATTSRLANQRGAIITLGEDQYHNKYFFLSAQVQMYLHGIHVRNVSEPLLFVYTMGKLHCVHCNHIPPVYQSLTNTVQCEYLLKYAMQTHFTIIKKALIALQAIKTSYSMFIGNPNIVAMYCQKQVDLPHTLVSKMLSLEIGYLRCVEYRSAMYAAFINHSNADVKKRYLRTIVSDGFCEVDSTHGYFFRDLYHGIRMLNSNTVASKLLAESAYLDILRAHFKKNRVRVYCKSGAEPVSHSFPGFIGTSLTPTQDDDQGESGRLGKPVEQLHLITGDVLRRYSSGRDAAALMEVSQSGISLCCKGIKPDAFGFKWRFYEEPAPPIVPLSIEVLKSMKFRNKKNDHLPLPPALDTQTVYHRLHQADVHPTSVPVNYRMLKLKIEILNILAILPFWNFKWKVDGEQPPTTIKELPNQTESVEHNDSSELVSRDETDDTPMEIAENNGSSNASEKCENIENDSVNDDESIDHNSNDEVSDESNEVTSRTTRSETVARAARSVPHVEEFRSLVLEIQAASTPQGLLECLWKLSSVIPPSFFVTQPKHTEYASCVADVANYLYTVDRSLRYEDIPLDLKYEHVEYRPRSNFTAKCILSNTCIKPAGHMTRCSSNPLADSYSRFAEFGELKLMTQKDEPQQRTPSGAPGMWPPLVHQRAPLLQPYVAPQHPAQQATVGDIQFVKPFVPRMEDITNNTWV